MKFGICCGPGSFVPQEQNAAGSSIDRMMQVMQDAGADYVEFAVGSVTGSEEEFEKLQSSLESHPLKVEAFNSFIPARHRLTGPDVQLDEVLKFCDMALRRC